MRIAVVIDDGEITSVWYPDITEEEWTDLTDDYAHNGSSVAGTLDEVLSDIKEVFAEG